MANSDTIKTAIDANINTNGNQAITGAVMNSILKQMVDATDEQLSELSENLLILEQEVNGGQENVITSSSAYVVYPLKAGRTYIIDTISPVKNVTLFARRNKSSEGQEVITYLEYVRSIEYTPSSDFSFLYIYYASSASGEVSFDIKVKDSLSDVRNLAENVSNIEASIEVLKTIDEVVEFNGVSSQCNVNLITLSKAGDYLEMDVTPYLNGQENPYFACVTGSSKSKNSIGCSRNAVSVRATDNSWIALGVNIGDKSRYVLGIYYRNGNIEICVDGEVVSSYNGYKAIDIGGFGYAQNVNSYWSGLIGKITINGIHYDTIAELSGYVPNNAVIRGRNGFLTEEQNRALLDVSLPKYHIIPSANIVDVYFQMKSNIYGKLGIKHLVNHTDNDGQNGYCDLWGLYDTGGVYLRDESSYTDIGKKLLINSENEFTIQFVGMGDFTGGYHGDERIDLASDDYVEFLVDGKVYTIEELISLGEIYCESFSYRQHSTMYASYVYDSAHKKLGNHFKETFFVNKGYVTRNFMKLDIASLDVTKLEVSSAFTGLVCAYRDVAKVIVADDGKQYVGINPSASTPLVDYMNQYSRRVSMNNGDYSCVIDSKLIDTSVESWKNSAPRVLIVDRQYDEKYYSYLPMNAMMSDGDYFATECVVEFNVY